MHIAFLTPEYPHTSLTRSGGLGTSIKNLATELVTQGIEVTVFVTGQDRTQEFIDNGVSILAIAKKKYRFLGWYLERKRIQKIIQQEVKKREIELIEAPDWTGLSAFMSFSVPLVIRMHGSDGYFCHLEGRKQKWKHQFLEGKALRSADALLSASSFTGELTKKLFRLKKSVTTIHNSIDTSVFLPINKTVKPLQLLYFGTLVRKKGVLELAPIFNEVVQQIPQAELLLVGKDNQDVFEHQSTWSLFQKALNPEAKERVSHLAEVPYEEIKTYIAQAQVVVLPSFAEAFPMTWLETLAMEKPLVSSNIGWANELMLDGQTGFTVNPKDHKLYVQRIVELLSDNDLCEKFGKAGRRHVIDHFSTPIILPQNIAFYNRIIHRFSNSR